MKITLLVVGKTTDININKLIDNYLNRLKFYIDFSIQVIPELKNSKNLRQDEQKEKEGELILKKIGKSDTVICMCIEGKMLKRDFTKSNKNYFLQNKFILKDGEKHKNFNNYNTFFRVCKEVF